MFISIKKKHLQLISLLVLGSITFYTLYLLSSKAELNIPKSSYLDLLTKNLYDTEEITKDVQLYVDPEIYFNKKIKSLYYKKIVNDIDNKYWLINTKVEDTTLQIPTYFKQSAKAKDVPFEKPPIQPFDPRFTLGMYFHYLNQELKKTPNVSIPFHWYDWKDMSILNKHLLASEKDQLDCSFLNALPDENIHLDEKDRKKAEEDAKLKKLEDERLEEERKKQQEEEDRKKEQEAILIKEKEDLKNALKEELAKQMEHELQEKLEKQKVDLQNDLIKYKDNPEELAKAVERLQAANDQIQGEAQPEVKEENNQENQEVKQEVKPEANDKDSDAISKREDDKEEKKKEEKKKDRKNEALPVDKFCLNNSEVPADSQDGNRVRPGFNVFRSPGKTTKDKSILIGTNYLYFAAPPPDQVIFLTKDGSYKVGTSNRAKLLDNGIVENYLTKTGSDSIDVAKQFKKLQKAHKPKNEDVISDYEIKIPEEDFIFNHENITDDFEARLLNNGPELSMMESKYYKSLKYSQHAVKNESVTKYFEESRIIGSILGDHYDWRFTNGIHYGAYEQTLVLHRLVRTWLSFCRKNGITTWVAHGSLLSWYWNGIAFPWDNDIDVQVPIMDLHKLSMNFNQTLIVEDAEDGFGRYFLDCGTFITLRERGNGLNNIDARFIDVDTGLYIDITGLAVSNSGAPHRYKDELLPEGWNEQSHNRTNTNLFLKAYNCRNNHFSLYSELSPLVKTIVEGEIGYVPRKYADILKVEYNKGLLSKKFSGHIFLPQLRLWIPHDDIYYFLQDKEKWKQVNTFSETYKGGEDGEDRFNLKYEITEAEKKAFKKAKGGLNDEDLATIFELSADELLDFLSKDEIFISYYNTHEFTHFHEEEIMRLLYGKSASKLLDSAPDFPPMKYEPFMFKLQTDFLTFENEVGRYSDLINSYKELEN